MKQEINIKIKEDCKRIIIDLENDTVVQEVGFEPKDGDFVAHTDRDGDTLIAIFTKKIGRKFIYYAGFKEWVKKIFIDNWADIEWLDRVATDTEKQTLLDALHSEGKDWDAENKKIVEWKWSPKMGEPYYTPDLGSELLYCWSSWCDNVFDRTRLERNLITKTSREAIEKAKKMLKSIEK
jgi:hypothetical protein